MKNGFDLTGRQWTATDLDVPSGRQCGLYSGEGDGLIKVSGYLRPDGKRVAAYLRRDTEATGGERGEVVNEREYKKLEQPVIDLLCEFIEAQGGVVLASVRGEKNASLQYPGSNLLMDILAMDHDGDLMFIEVDASNDVSKEKNEFILHCVEPSIKMLKVDVTARVVRDYICEHAPTFEQLLTWHRRVIEPVSQTRLVSRVRTHGIPLDFTNPERVRGRYNGLRYTIFERDGTTRIWLQSSGREWFENYLGQGLDLVAAVKRIKEVSWSLAQSS